MSVQPGEILIRVIKSDPINSTASRVMQKGAHWTPELKIDQQTWDSPPPMKALPSNIADLSGRRVGRLVVLGKLDGAKSLWVVRCDCGRYLTRRAKSIRNPLNDTDACDFCRHLMFLKRDQIRRFTGQQVAWRDL